MALLILAFAVLAAPGSFWSRGWWSLRSSLPAAEPKEAHLLARFGEPYRKYRESTGRFLPKRPSGRR